MSISFVTSRDNEKLILIGSGKIDLVKENKKRILIAITMSIICHFIITLCCSIISSTPDFAAKGYVGCLKSKNYSKAIDYFTGIPAVDMVKDDNIKTILKNTYDSAQDIKILEVNPISGSGMYEVNFEIINGHLRSNSRFLLLNMGDSFMGLQNNWKVVFPFKVRDLCITGVDGSKIFIDSIECGEISGGSINIQGIICGIHDFRAEIEDIGQTIYTKEEINEYSDKLELKVLPESNFKKLVEKLITDFCTSWSQYCLNESPNSMQPYLTDRLYKQYLKEIGMQSGSKYVTCEYTVSFKEISFLSREKVSIVVNEVWKLKEVITDSKVIFILNGKETLEQYQELSWRYFIVNDSGSWKIDGVEQISFNQRVLN